LGLVGAAVVSLPLFFPDPNTPLGGAGNNVYRVTVADLARIPGSVQITGPNLAAAFSGLTLLDNRDVLVPGVDRLLTTLQNSLQQRTLRGLPIVGNNLANAARFIEAFRAAFVQRVRAAFGRDADLAGRLQQFLYDLLGPGGLNLLRDLSGDGQI